MRDDTDDQLPKHLASLAKSLGYEVIGPWLYKHAEVLPQWAKLAATIDSQIWNELRPPISMFIMKANWNRRCYEYSWPEAADVWHLRPFRDAADRVLKHVRIFWGHGVIEDAVRNRYGQLVNDMFSHDKVVYKQQDIEQGNRSNIMAPWWHEPPEDEETLEYCDLLVGLYSPVHAAFTHGDLRRLMNALNHDALRLYYDALIQRNLEETNKKLAEALESKRPGDWPTLAILLNNLDFLPILACDVERPATDERLEIRHTEICPHFFRHWVTLRLPEKFHNGNWAPSPGWHPLGADADDSVLVDLHRNAAVVIRHAKKPQALQDLSPAVTFLLAKTHKDVQDIEQELQYVCHGLPSPQSFPNELKPLLDLALQEDVQSVSLVRTAQGEEQDSVKQYPKELSRKGNPKRIELITTQRSEVVLHLEAYCNRSGAAKNWTRELVNAFREKSLPESLTKVAAPAPTSIEESPWKLTLFLMDGRKNSRVDQKLKRVFLEHVQAIEANSIHNDPYINAALLFYKQQRVWPHDPIQNCDEPYRVALNWLGVAWADPQSIKALLMNAHPTENNQKSLRELSDRQQQNDARWLEWVVLANAARKLGMTIEWSGDPPSPCVSLPVVPGVAFLAAVRKLMKELGQEKAVLTFTQAGNDDQMGTYKLTISHSAYCAPASASRDCGGLGQTREDVKRCRVHALLNEKDVFQYFAGLDKTVITVTFTANEDILEWSGVKPSQL